MQESFEPTQPQVNEKKRCRRSLRMENQIQSDQKRAREELFARMADLREQLQRVLGRPLSLSWSCSICAILEEVGASMAVMLTSN